MVQALVARCAVGRGRVKTDGPEATARGKRSWSAKCNCTGAFEA